jgi:hypothetical protein
VVKEGDSAYQEIQHVPEMKEKRTAVWVHFRDNGKYLLRTDALLWTDS